MKTRFSSLDIIAILPELRAKLCTGWRVNQIYDCDQKTYLFKLNKSIVQMKKDDDPVNVKEETSNKLTLVIESGIRLHTTDFDWPKSHAPSQFATKLRKNLRNKRIEDIQQIGIDRLIDIRFGSNLAANHLIVELYDKGNLVLTDHEYTILAILRWRRPTDKTNSAITNEETSAADDSENFKVGQTYPLSRSRKVEDLEPMDQGRIIQLLNHAKILLGGSQNYKKRNKVKQYDKDGMREINLKDLLNPYVIYGSSLLEDKLIKHLSLHSSSKVTKAIIKIDLDNKGCLDQNQVTTYAKVIRDALDEADMVLNEVKERKVSPGYIVQKQQSSNMNGGQKNKKQILDKAEDQGTITTYLDFFPILSCVERKIELEPNGLSYQEYETFDKSVDVYFCSMESQKLDSRALSAEKEAMKKLKNLKIAQEKRLDDLAKAQKEDEEKARLIELNSDKVEDALLIIRSMIANQVPWSDIWATIKEAQSMNDPIASLITGVKFARNEFTIKLSDPYERCSGTDSDEDKEIERVKPSFKLIDIDIGLSAYANARKFFTKRRTAVNKEKKTIEVSKKAFKNVERQTKEMLNEVVVKTNITKARKRYWFENFFWFISTDGYLVVAGRDAEQNELLVKRYMKKNDLYVHADLHGASSVIIKNEFSTPVPPKTLEEAGCMSVCYSSAWDSKIATNSYWVYPNQVSKSAPAGEYLTVGAFMIRGKKNFLPLANLVLGFGFLFRLGDESIDRRRAQRIEKELSQQEQLKEEEASSEGHIESDVERISIASDKPNEENEHEQDGEETIREVDEISDEDEDLEKPDHRLIDTMTEAPLPDDILLYAIPMCGPYSAFQSFKYKAKVVPGANKRGKAAKASLGVFLHDKTATQREKDLLRALKDQDYARNMPNNVKISAANLKSIIKKKPKRSEVRLPL